MTTHVVELASGVERFSFPSYAMAFHPRGTGFAVACEEQRDPVAFSDAGKTVMVELLPIVSGGRKTIVVPTDRVSSLAFSPDGERAGGQRSTELARSSGFIERTMGARSKGLLARLHSVIRALLSLRRMVGAWRRAWLIRRL